MQGPEDAVTNPVARALLAEQALKSADAGARQHVQQAGQLAVRGTVSLLLLAVEWIFLIVGLSCLINWVLTHDTARANRWAIQAITGLVTAIVVHAGRRRLRDLGWSLALRPRVPRRRRGPDA